MRERLDRDPMLRGVVESLAQAITRLELTPTEVREAAEAVVYACIQAEHRQLRQKYLTKGEAHDIRRNLKGLDRIVDAMEERGLMDDEEPDDARPVGSITAEHLGKPPEELVLEWTAEPETGAMRWKEVLMPEDGHTRIRYRRVDPPMRNRRIGVFR